MKNLVSRNKTPAWFLFARKMNQTLSSTEYICFSSAEIEYDKMMLVSRDDVNVTVGFKFGQLNELRVGSGIAGIRVRIFLQGMKNEGQFLITNRVENRNWVIKRMKWQLPKIS